MPLVSPAVRVLIAPDSFKGTLSAAAAARAIADGWGTVRPDDDLVLRPMADGGEGTVEVIAAATAGEVRSVQVPAHDGSTVTAEWLLLPDGSALVELASASGLTLPGAPAPWTAGTAGFGRVIAAALDAGADGLLLAIGGSASTDGGAGMLAALGARLLDAAGDPIGPGARGLLDLDRVDVVGLRPAPPRGAVILSDVGNPAVGPTGAAAVFGPQKGLGAAEVPAVDAALRRFAALLGVDPEAPGTGAAGGTGLSLAAWGAVPASGAERVAEVVGLAAAATGAALVITGEGRFDGQTADGKVAQLVARVAAEHGAPVALVAGSIEASTADYLRAVELATLAGSSARAMREPRRWLELAGARLADDLSRSGFAS